MKKTFLFLVLLYLCFPQIIHSSDEDALGFERIFGDIKFKFTNGKMTVKGNGILLARNTIFDHGYELSADIMLDKRADSGYAVLIRGKQDEWNHLPFVHSIYYNSDRIKNGVCKTSRLYEKHSYHYSGKTGRWFPSIKGNGKGQRSDFFHEWNSIGRTDAV